MKEQEKVTIKLPKFRLPRLDNAHFNIGIDGFIITVLLVLVILGYINFWVAIWAYIILEMFLD